MKGQKSFIALFLLVSVAVSLSVSGCAGAKNTAQPPASIDKSLSAVNALTINTAAEAGRSTTGTPDAGNVVQKPDLIVTDIFMQVDTIYYTVRNNGNAGSPATVTYLYVDGRLPVSGSSSYVEPLAAGAERTLSFAQYRWQYLSGVYFTGADKSAIAGRLSFYPVRSPEGDYQDPGLDQNKIEVCADARNEVAESDEKNNCMTRVWGILYNRDLLTNGHFAYWVNSSAMTPSPSSETNPGGAYIKLSGGGYEMVPEQKPNGWIQGVIGYYFSNSITQQMMSFPVRVPAKTSFVARIGLDNRAAGNDGVTFKLGLMDRKGNIVFLPGKSITVPGTFEDWEINLKDYEGQIVYFILRVESGSSFDRNFALWNEAALVQQE